MARSLFTSVVAAIFLFHGVSAEAAPEPAKDSGFDHKPKRPGDKVLLQLEDADLADLVRVIGEATGKRFIVASPKLGKVKASLYSPKEVTVAEAYQAFLAVLTANGLTVIPGPGFYKIVESQEIGRQLTPIERGALPNEERYITRIHRLERLSAEEIATSVLQKLASKDASIIPYAEGNLLIITETASNLRRMLEVLEAIDTSTESDKLWFVPLKNVASSQVEKQLSDLLDLKKKSAPGGGALHVGRIVALDRPNALAIVATKPSYDRIVEILERIDIAPSNDAQVHVVMLQYATATKIVAPLNEALGGGAAGGTVAAAKTGAPSAPAAVLEAAAKVSADDTTNALIVTATARDYVQIKSVIDALDKPKRQVFIEAAILDVSMERSAELGIAWHGGEVSEAALGKGNQTVYGGFRAANSATLSATDLQAFAIGIRGPSIPFLPSVPGLDHIPSFGAFLSAVAISKSADILSTPTIVASDNTPAEIKVQLQTSLQPNAPQSSVFIPGLSTPGAASTSGVGASYRGIGPRVKVTPHLNDSDLVRLDVDELISDIQSAPAQNDPYGTISYIERTATTTMTVRDGETVVIGGLVRNRTARQERKVPVLGDIPLIGALFRTRADTVEKSNLILVLTPHILRDSSDMRKILERKQQERQELIDREAIFGAHEWEAPKTYAHTLGLLGDIRRENRELTRKRSELAAAEPAPAEPKAVTPIDLPVPPTTTPSTTTTPTGPVPARAPNVIEK